MTYERFWANTWARPLYIGRPNHGPNSNELAQVKAHVEMNWAGFGLGPGPNIKRPLDCIPLEDVPEELGQLQRLEVVHFEDCTLL